MIEVFRSVRSDLKCLEVEKSWFILMKTSLIPSTLSDEERKLKEIHEKLRQMRRLIAERRSLGSGDVSKTEKTKVKRSLEQAEVATEEVKRKVIAGAITVKKVKEKCTFKRPRIDRRRRVTSIIEEGEIVDSISCADTDSCFNQVSSTSSSTSAENCKEYGGPTIVIRGSHFQEEEIKQKFGKFGDVLCIKFDEEPKREEEAFAAAKEMNGSILSGTAIEVSIAEQQSSSCCRSVCGDSGVEETRWK